jgi:hypothetical protein
MKVKPNGSNQSIVESSNGVEVLYSYKTPVALQSPNGAWYKTDRKWSVTTSKHINKFLPSDQSRVNIISQDLLDNWENNSWK